MLAEPDRRKWDRHPADPQTVCRLLIDGSVPCQALAVCNLSEGGARLLIGRPVPPGWPLWVFLEHEGRRVYGTRMARVVYAFPVSGGFHVLGIAFHRELSAAEVEGLRGPGVGAVASGDGSIPGQASAAGAGPLRSPNGLLPRPA